MSMEERLRIADSVVIQFFVIKDTSFHPNEQSFAPFLKSGFVCGEQVFDWIF